LEQFQTVPNCSWNRTGTEQFKLFCSRNRKNTGQNFLDDLYESTTSYRTKVQRPHKLSYDRKINVRVRRNRHMLSYDRTTQYDGIVRNSYDSLWPFRPSYECILHSYDDFVRCLW